MFQYRRVGLPAGQRGGALVGFARDVCAQRRVEALVGEQVRALGLGRLEAARDLVLAAGAAFEARNPARDAIVD